MLLDDRRLALADREGLDRRDRRRGWRSSTLIVVPLVRPVLISVARLTGGALGRQLRARGPSFFGQLVPLQLTETVAPGGMFLTFSCTIRVVFLAIVKRKASTALIGFGPAAGGGQPVKWRAAAAGRDDERVEGLGRGVAGGVGGRAGDARGADGHALPEAGEHETVGSGRRCRWRSSCSLTAAPPAVAACTTTARAPRAREATLSSLTVTLRGGRTAARRRPCR